MDNRNKNTPSEDVSGNASESTIDTDPRGDKPGTDPQRPKEIGGREGPDPTRYGDWEKNGRCIDF